MASKQIAVKVVPRARMRSVKTEGDIVKVYTPAPAVDGKANAAVVEQLAEHFKVKKSQVVILRGLQSRQKIVQITA